MNPTHDASPIASSPLPSTSNDQSTSSPADSTTSSTQFSMLITPEMKNNGTRKRYRKSINYKAVRIQKRLFDHNNNEEKGDKKAEKTIVKKKKIKAPPANHKVPTVANTTSRLLLDSNGIVEFQVNDYAIVFLIFHFGTTSEIKKFYVGKIQKIGVGKNRSQVRLNMMRKIPTDSRKDTIGFCYPNIPDICNVDPLHIVQNFGVLAENRSRIFICKSSIKIMETFQ